MSYLHHKVRGCSRQRGNGGAALLLKPLGVLVLGAAGLAVIRGGHPFRTDLALFIDDDAASFGP